MVGDGIAVRRLQFLDEPFGNGDRADVAVDRIRTDGQHGHVAHDVVLPDANVGTSRADVHHGGAEFLFVLRQYGGRTGLGVGEEPAGGDAQPGEGLLQTLQTAPVAQHEVEGGLELLAETADGLLGLLARVDDVFLRDAVEDADTLGRLQAGHAFVQALYVLLADLVILTAHIHEVGAVRTFDVVTGNACVGFRDLDAQLFLQLGDGAAHGGRNLFDVDDLAAGHALHRTRHHVDDIEPAVGILAAGGGSHLARAEVYGCYVVIVFHCCLSLVVACKHLQAVRNRLFRPLGAMLLSTGGCTPPGRRSAGRCSSTSPILRAAGPCGRTSSACPVSVRSRPASRA